MNGVRKFACAVVAAVLSLAAVETLAVTLTVDKVQQRYPWNGLVDIDYTVTTNGVETFGPDENLEVLFVDKGVSPAVTNRANCFLQGALPLTNGQHRITWDAHTDGITNRTDHGEFLLMIKHYAAQYMVIDVSGGPDTNVYPVTYLNGEPNGGFNVNEYKGDKIALRRIHSGSYIAGSPSTEVNRSGASEVQHRVALSKSFYIGIFEITQRQYLNVMGGTNPSGYTGDFRPVETVLWRGTVRAGSWPGGAPAANTFMDKLLQKCRSRNADTGEYDVPVTGFDLPTEFQWEYACRAGTTGAFNTTNEYANTTAGQKAVLATLGRSSDNGGSTEFHTVVGSYQPNQWGLYDMHGNVCEWCLDSYLEQVETLKQYLDPVGPAQTKYPLLRGGSWKNATGGCRSASRWLNNADSSRSFPYIGFRLCRTVP